MRVVGRHYDEILIDKKFASPYYKMVEGRKDCDNICAALLREGVVKFD
jgi:hypothetical protein